MQTYWKYKIIFQKSNSGKKVLEVVDKNIEFPTEFISKENITMTDKAKIVYEFNKLVINSIHDKCIAIKPRLAYYELLSSEGIRDLDRRIYNGQ